MTGSPVRRDNLVAAPAHAIPLSVLRTGPLGPRSAANRDTRFAPAPLTACTVPFAPVPSDLGSPVLRLTRAQYDVVVAHCLDCFPEEACGLLVGPLEDDEPTGEITAVFPCENAAHSAKLYRVGGRDLVRTTLDANARGEEIVAVWHSHTHTDAYPSPTDVAQAIEAQQLERPWLYPIVSLKDGDPVLRAYWLRGGEITEVPVEVAP